MHWREGSYCATRSPKSFEEDFFILTHLVNALKFLVHRRWGRQATALKRSPKSFEEDFFILTHLVNALKFLVHRR